MRIIETGTKHLKWPKRVTCEKCGSKIEVDQADTYVTREKFLAVKCPVCKRRVVVWQNTQTTTQESKKKVGIPTKMPTSKAFQHDDQPKEEIDYESVEWLDAPSGFYPGLNNRQARQRSEAHEAERRRRIATQQMIGGRMKCKGGCDTDVGGCFVHASSC